MRRYLFVTAHMSRAKAPALCGAAPKIYDNDRLTEFLEIAHGIVFTFEKSV